MGLDCFSRRAPGRPRVIANNKGVPHNRSLAGGVQTLSVSEEGTISALRGCFYDRRPKREGTQGDQRAANRYGLQLDLFYRVFLKTGWVGLSGTGRTVNVSTRGILFRCSAVLIPDMTIELLVRWPVLAESTHQMELVARGKIARSNEQGTAVRVMYLELRRADPGQAGEAPPA